MVQATAPSQSTQRRAPAWAFATCATAPSCSRPAEKSTLLTWPHSAFMASRQRSSMLRSPSGSATAVQKKGRPESCATRAISRPRFVPSAAARSSALSSGEAICPAWAAAMAGTRAAAVPNVSGSSLSSFRTAPKNSPAFSRTRPVAQASYGPGSRFTTTIGTPLRRARHGSSLAGRTISVLPMTNSKSAPSTASREASTAVSGIGWPNMTVSVRRGQPQVGQGGTPAALHAAATPSSSASGSKKLQLPCR
mmetsp:Transcript_24138/g.69677  ORF Transcript_24138/g.69677 Transcript_24138/m.69677 type:complete len:251 (-) Transcript_24138:281-1033(-)